MLINSGKVFRSCVVKGKVSSLNSYVTNTQQLVFPYGSGYYNGSGAYYAPAIPMPSADLDGSYGDNPKGIFFWTTSGEYLEWGGDQSGYMLSSRPVSLVTPPEITLQVK